MRNYLIGAMLALSLFLLITCIGVLNRVKDTLADDTQFQFVVTDTMMTVYNGSTYVGTVRVQGQLDSLLVDYNQ